MQTTSSENIHRHHHHLHQYSEESSPSPPHISNKDTKVKKKSKPAKDSSQVLEKRRFQNRLAQRASRVRKAQHLKELEDEISKKNEVISQQRNIISRLQIENSKLRTCYLSGVPTPSAPVTTTLFDSYIPSTSVPTSPLLINPLALSSTPCISSDSSPNLSPIGLPSVGGGREWEDSMGAGGGNGGLMKTATQFFIPQPNQQQQQQLEETQQQQFQPTQQFFYHFQPSQSQSHFQPSPSVFGPSNPISVPTSIPQTPQFVIHTRKSNLTAPRPSQSQTNYDSFSKSQSPEISSIVGVISEEGDKSPGMLEVEQNYSQQQQEVVALNIRFGTGVGWIGPGIGAGWEERG